MWRSHLNASSIGVARVGVLGTRAAQTLLVDIEALELLLGLRVGLGALLGFVLPSPASPTQDPAESEACDYAGGERDAAHDGRV